MDWSRIALIVICIFILLILIRFFYVKYLQLHFLEWQIKFLRRLLKGINFFNRGIDFLEKKFEPVAKFFKRIGNVIERIGIGKVIERMGLILKFLILSILTLVFSIFDWIHLLLTFVVTLFFIFTSYVFIKIGLEIQEGKMSPQSPLLIISDQEWQQLLSFHILSGVSLILLCITLSLFFISLKGTLQLSWNPYILLRDLISRLDR